MINRFRQWLWRRRYRAWHKNVEPTGGLLACMTLKEHFDIDSACRRYRDSIYVNAHDTAIGSANYWEDRIRLVRLRV